MIKKQWQKTRVSGFTLVELLIVITVIVILATITAFSFLNVQKQTRDSHRSASVNIIAEALESYYSANGEYPSCSALTQSADQVTTNTLKGLDKDVFEAPDTSPTNGNSIVCSDLTSSGSSDVYAYVGDGSSDCSSGSSCLEWTLKYREEATGQIKTIHSRHTTKIATSGSLTLVATTANNNQINVSWNAIPNATSYQLQRSTSSSMSSPATTTYTSTSTAATGLVAGERYYFRVRPEAVSSEGEWSNVASAVTSISPPSSNPTITATLINTNTGARGTAGGTSCEPGTTLEYSIRYNFTKTTTDGSWSSWSVGSTRDQTSTYDGNKYTFQSQARCIGSDLASSYKTSSVTDYVVPPIATPSAPGWQIPTEWLAGYNYKMSYSWSCPSGTDIGPEGVQSYSNSNSGSKKTTPYYDWWYVGWNSGQYDDYDTYTANYRCRTAYTEKWSPVTTTQIHAYCSVDRRSFSVSPRCDNYGQGQAGNGYYN